MCSNCLISTKLPHSQWFSSNRERERGRERVVKEKERRKLRSKTKPILCSTGIHALCLVEKGDRALKARDSQ